MRFEWMSEHGPLLLLKSLLWSKVGAKVLWIMLRSDRSIGHELKMENCPPHLMKPNSFQVFRMDTKLWHDSCFFIIPVLDIFSTLTLKSNGMFSTLTLKPFRLQLVCHSDCFFFLLGRGWVWAIFVWWEFRFEFDEELMMKVPIWWKGHGQWVSRSNHQVS